MREQQWVGLALLTGATVHLNYSCAWPPCSLHRAAGMKLTQGEGIGTTVKWKNAPPSSQQEPEIQWRLSTWLRGRQGMIMGLHSWTGQKGMDWHA